MIKIRYINICKQRPGLLRPGYGFAKNINISNFRNKIIKNNIEVAKKEHPPWQLDNYLIKK